MANPMLAFYPPGYIDTIQDVDPNLDHQRKIDQVKSEHSLALNWYA